MTETLERCQSRADRAEAALARVQRLANSIARAIPRLPEDDREMAANFVEDLHVAIYDAAETPDQQGGGQ